MTMAIHEKRQYGTLSVHGLSLVELLVAMLLGVILSGGMVITYLGAKQNSFYEVQMARIQENGRYAMRLLSRELVMAGFFAGVPTLEGISPADLGADCSDQYWVLDGTHPLELVNDYPGQSIPVSTRLTPFTCMDGEDISSGTDLLAVKRTAGEASLRRGVSAERLTTSTVQSWYLSLASGEPQAWEKIAPIDFFDSAYADQSGSYWEAITRIFFIRRYSDSQDQGDEIPTLCMETLAGDVMTSRCLVEGVEDMQFEFGIDTDADGVPNQYTSAPSAEEMQHAVGAKIYLLLRSISKISGVRDGKTYTLGQKVLTARHDAYLRRVFSSTVLLRNQIKPPG
jgi:type IV pilus assembly protein PilW